MLNTWYPDTCPCAITFSVTSGVISFSNAVECQFHSGLGGSGLFTTVISENSMKNIVLQVSINTLPSTLSDSGLSGGNLASGIFHIFAWSGTSFLGTGIGSGRFLTSNFSGALPNAIELINLNNAINGAGFSGNAKTGVINIAACANCSGVASLQSGIVISGPGPIAVGSGAVVLPHS